MRSGQDSGEQAAEDAEKSCTELQGGECRMTRSPVNDQEASGNKQQGRSQVTGRAASSQEGGEIEREGGERLGYTN